MCLRSRLVWRGGTEEPQQRSIHHALPADPDIERSGKGAASTIIHHALPGLSLKAPRSNKEKQSGKGDGKISATLYMILAGGEGQRLKPLTDHWPKPMVRFGSSSSIIDFTLYNCLTSRGGDVVVLTQWQSESIANYLKTYWQQAFATAGRKLIELPALKTPKRYFDGTADAVYQALSTMDKLPDNIIVLAGDHVYRMDYRSMLDFHLDHGNVATIGATLCPTTEAKKFGILNIKDNRKIVSFHEKPRDLKIISTYRGMLVSSMGIYIFQSKRLMDYLKQMQDKESLDFGYDVLPRIVDDREACAFLFTGKNGEPAYWRDVGDLTSYREAHMDLLEGKHGVNYFSPLPGMGRVPFSRKDMVDRYRLENKSIDRSLIARTARIGDASIKRSVIGPAAVIHDGARIKDSVVLDRAVIGPGVELDKAVLAPRAQVGMDGRGFKERARHRIPLTG